MSFTGALPISSLKRLNPEFRGAIANKTAGAYTITTADLALGALSIITTGGANANLTTPTALIMAQAFGPQVGDWLEMSVKINVVANTEGFTLVGGAGVTLGFPSGIIAPTATPVGELLFNFRINFTVVTVDATGAITGATCVIY